jgi:hypothetical protein
VTTPAFAAALATLLANDLYLKPLYGNWLTGKLSDVAGLAVVTLLLAPFVGHRAKSLVAAIAIAFAYWKSPWSQPLIDFVNARSPIRFGRVVDYTDLLALAAVPAALRLYRTCARMRIEPTLLRRLALAPLLALVVAGITGTSAVGYVRSVVVEAEPAAASLPSAASIATDVLESRGYTCTGAGPICENDDNWVQFCTGSARLVLVVTGPINGGLVGPTTTRRKRKNVDEIVGELRSALEPEFVVAADDRDYRNTDGSWLERADQARALCETLELRR